LNEDELGVSLYTRIPYGVVFGAVVKDKVYPPIFKVYVVEAASEVTISFDAFVIVGAAARFVAVVALPVMEIPQVPLAPLPVFVTV